MKKRRLGCIFLVACLMFVLTACSSNDSKSGESSGEHFVIYGRGADSVSLDPITITDGESFKVARNIFETLLVF